MRTTPSFPVGFHAFHPDVSINYQLNRFCDGSPESVAELTSSASRIGGYADYVRELLALSAAAEAEGRALAGALYLRSAEFYLLPGDPRKAPARRHFCTTMREVFGVGGTTPTPVHHGRTTVDAYRFTPAQPRGTIVIFGGFDSYMEELLGTAGYFVGAGYDVVLAEGPGQGGVLEDRQEPLTPDWAPVVSAVLDHYALDGVTLLGYSLGGCLVVRAAAGEPRVRRVVCDDVLTDLAQCSLRQLPTASRRVLATLLRLRARSAVNRLAARAGGRSPVVEWGLRHGMHTTGTLSPYDFLRATALYETGSVSARVTQDVLLLAGSRDHYVPASQLTDQVRSLTAARSVTVRVLTEAESAQSHVHVGNVGLSLQVVAAWLAGLDDRDRDRDRGRETGLGAAPAGGPAPGS